MGARYRALVAGLVVGVGLGCDGDPAGPEPVASVRVEPGAVSLEVAQTRQFAATALSGGGGALPGLAVEWSVLDTTVAVVSPSGIVTARAAGATRVRASIGGVAGFADVSVSGAGPAPGPVTGVELNTDSMRVEEGERPVLEAVARDAAGAVVPGLVVQWSSSDPSIAPVAPDGSVTALRPGTAYITARVHGITASARLDVWAEHAYDLLFSGWAGVPGVAPELYRLDIRHPDATPAPIAVTGMTVTDAVPSPDGRRIAYSANHYGNGGGLFVAGIDGSNPVRLTSDPFDDQPAWSRDGTRIAFRRWRFGDGEDADVWVVNADGTGLRNLTDGFGATNQGWPTWSPEENGVARIAFSHAAGGVAHIWVMGADGTGPEPITSGAVYDDQPAWAPDGQTVAFQRTHDGGTSDLYLVAAAGGAVRLLLQQNELPGSQWAPAWSPDGRLIAFTSRHEGLGSGAEGYQVYTTDLLGQRIARRTADATDKVKPVFVAR